MEIPFKYLDQTLKYSKICFNSLVTKDLNFDINK